MNIMDMNIVVDRLIHSLGAKFSKAQIAAAASAVCLCSIDTEFVKQRSVKHLKWGKHVASLTKIPQPAQRSEEWYAMRGEMITASDLAECLGYGKFNTQRDFFIKKCGPPAAKPVIKYDAPLVWGTKYEHVAAELYKKKHGVDMIDFGLLRHPRHSHIGASPDGITTNGIMVEIKCPFKRKPQPGDVPVQYYYQIQSQLDVCDLDECDYFECVFKEYDTHDEYAADLLASDKGVFWEIPGKKGECVQYDYEKECPGAKPTYWKLQEMNIVRVYRDKDFIDDKYEKALAVWQNVLRYRSDEQAYVKEIATKKERKKKDDFVDVSLGDGCLCDSGDDDDNV